MEFSDDQWKSVERQPGPIDTDEVREGSRFRVARRKGILTFEVRLDSGGNFLPVGTTGGRFDFDVIHDAELRGGTVMVASTAIR